jgi:hypothetical protein
MAASNQSITAEIPYLKGDLERLHVEFTARILAPETFEPRAMEVRNGRADPKPTLDVEGFQLAHWPSCVVRERLDELMAEQTALQIPQAKRDYWDDTIPLIKQLSGAREILPLHASTVRFSPKAEKKKFMTPAGWPHTDYDPEEAVIQLKETLELNGCDPRPFSRYVLYQGWRALTPPPQDYPLAICDGRTVKARTDFVPIDYHLQSDDRDVNYRSRGSRYSARHRWWYFPDMTPDEMLVFIGFDSARPDDMITLHVAFEDQTAVNPFPRASVESRYFALFD